EEVEYAIIETNGSMTVMPKADSRPLCPSDIGHHPPRESLPLTIIMEGKFLDENFSLQNDVSKDYIFDTLKSKSLAQENIMLLLLSTSGLFIQPYNADSQIIKFEQ
ncbi:MAG: DUF421 domain-containing protein, partial [Clostridia bacterium]|nr:DUF421 domain-containing protein [Clostridia bacterium]